MKNMLNPSKGSSVLMAAITFILGLILVIFPGTATVTLCLILGIALMVLAVVAAIFYFKDRGDANKRGIVTLIIAAVAFLLGLWMVISPVFWVRFLFIIFGLLMLYHGFVDISNALAMKNGGMQRWWIYLIMAVITMILGIVVIIAPFITMTFMVVLCGIALIFDAVTDIIIVLTADKAAEK